MKMPVPTVRCFPGEQICRLAQVQRDEVGCCAAISACVRGVQWQASATHKGCFAFVQICGILRRNPMSQAALALLVAFPAMLLQRRRGFIE